MKKNKTSKKILILIYLITVAILSTPLIIATLFYYGEQTVPLNLFNLKFQNKAGYLSCDSVYTITIKDEKSNETSLFVGQSDMDLSQYCENNVVFNAKIEKYYQKPLCKNDSRCPNSSVVLKIKSIEISKQR